VAKIFHADLHGLSGVKDKALSTLDITQTNWSSVDIKASSFYLLIPQNSDLWREYDQFWKITEIMPVNSVGIVTARDALTIHWSKEEILQTVNEFAKLPVEVARQKYDLSADSRDWKVNLAQEDLKRSGVSDSSIVPILYRPFDIRYTYYTGKSKGFHCMPRGEVMQHMLAGDNLGLIARRSMIGDLISYFSVSQYIISDGVIRSDNKGSESLFPLYLYPTTSAEIEMGITRKPNISAKFLTKFEQNLGYIPIPEVIFYYIYAIFHSPTYRNRYAEFLKMDFPRVPITSDDKLFRSLGDLGEKLVNLHLMKSPVLAQTSSPFIKNGGGCIVDAGHPKYENSKVIINKKQDCFVNVPEAVWNFHVGGYQVCQKWLKDRKGRTLSPDDISHYQKIVVALGQTIELMTKIDEAIPNWPIQ
jgi:predicted helicase